MSPPQKAWSTYVTIFDDDDGGGQDKAPHDGDDYRQPEVPYEDDSHGQREAPDGEDRYGRRETPYTSLGAEDIRLDSLAPSQLNNPDEHRQGETPYRSLGVSDIRLVNLTPGLLNDPISINVFTADLTKNPRYTALSYVWSPQDKTIDTALPPAAIEVIGYPSVSLKIGPNLAAAMRQHRSPSTVQTL